MPRSVEGLKGAGEWHMLQKMLPDFQRKRDQIPQNTNHLCKWTYPKWFRDYRTRGTRTR